MCKKKKTKSFIGEYREPIQETITKIEQNINFRNEKNQKSVQVIEKLKNDKVLNPKSRLNQKKI